MAEKVQGRSERPVRKNQGWQVRWKKLPTTPELHQLDEERLAVLKMLAEGKINAEQAEALLAALEA